ncbi:MAG: hypothetical protein AABW89_02780 [Nanoarchaeota archaeon]
MKKSTFYKSTTFIFLTILFIIAVLQFQGQPVIAEGTTITCPGYYTCNTGGITGTGSGSTREQAKQNAIDNCVSNQASALAAFEQCVTQLTTDLTQQCFQLTSEGLQCSPDVDATIDYYECDVHVDACNQINSNTWTCTAFGGASLYTGKCTPSAPPGGN